MDLLSDFNRIMTEQTDIALASSYNDHPNVRIVNFYCNTNQPGIIYFATFSDNRKVEEFSHNSKVAFTTIPRQGSTAHVRSHDAQIQQSKLTIYDLREAFAKKIPNYDELVKQAGNQMILYEIHFPSATVTIDHTQSGEITFQ